MGLTKAQIEEAGKAKIVEHNVPWWGGDVNVRVMPMKDRIAIETRFVDDLPGEDGKKIMNREQLNDLQIVVALSSLVDDDGEQMFATKDELFEQAGPLYTIISDIFSIATGGSEPKKSKTNSSSTE